MTLNMSSLDLSPKPQSQHPTVSSVILLQCVTDFSSLPHPACTTCSPLSLYHLSKWQVHPSSYWSSKQETLLIPHLLLPKRPTGKPSENYLGSTFKICPESEQFLLFLPLPPWSRWLWLLAVAWMHWLLTTLLPPHKAGRVILFFLLFLF